MDVVDSADKIGDRLLKVNVGRLSCVPQVREGDVPVVVVIVVGAAAPTGETDGPPLNVQGLA
jgi:hypothetical protein